MRFLTDRKRAEGRGSAHAGTEHHWYMQVSAVGLAFIVPAFIYMFGSLLGAPHEQVIASLSRPFPAILSALVLVFGLAHFRKGAQMMIEDYTRKSTKKVLIILVITMTYGLTAAGLFALAKIAL
ncbi:succinate dehydrogenase, hydrophobic membrane anchor protein [Shimia haliotis]|uniref:Succinate dehydrogenase hydrophobic membrane anchor subunit n=1 Tax=Shimia haliotis TaxID=1280847 RepID=A0A1I4CTR8_9RHOB|nr:succinate dehydrogenase, hydrophobic membrane anchor protein [Shimia haliotis]SFK83311.1 succinate dehydrogenase / fumarate reductase membrane anchor subunit [Shimia haliotis]